MPWLNVYLGILLLEGCSLPKIFLKFDAIIAIKPATLLKNLISCQMNLDIIFTSTKKDPHVVLLSNVIGNELIRPHSS